MNRSSSHFIFLVSSYSYGKPCPQFTVKIQNESFILERVVCFYSSWTHYREGDANFEVGDIDTSLCSHILYSYLKIDDNQVTHNDNNLDPPNGLGKFVKSSEETKSKRTFL